jgi:hypothetical protein
MTNSEQRPNFTASGVDTLELEAKEKYLELKQVLAEKYRQTAQEKRVEELHKIVNLFTNKLMGQYPDARDYVFFHLLVGSTPPLGLSKIDFSGDYSIESFINNLSL